ncbi:MAG: TVP38/TMEM64 family protein [Patescibacteria group bacterium]
MISNRWVRVLRIVIAILWILAVVVGILWFVSLGIPFRRLPHALRVLVHSVGMWGPVFILGLYALRSVFFFFPMTVLTIVTGSVYGPVWGSLLNILGENLTANVSFAISRILGRRFVREHERGWLKNYDNMLRQEGFLALLFMRSLYFPFDIVNYGSGVSGIMYRQFFFGTLLGLVPAIITFTVLGDASRNPKALLAFLALFVSTTGCVLLLRRTAWVKRRLYPPHIHEKI